MRRSVIPSSGTRSPPHVIVIGNQKGGSGKSTFAMHIIVALLKAGKRVASFDLDLNQLTLTRYIGNRHEWARKHEQNLELPDHYPVTEEVLISAYPRGYGCVGAKWDTCADLTWLHLSAQ
jgi:Mrp family chromosome partitioning ATPase